jgi:hypothetical protein
MVGKTPWLVASFLVAKKLAPETVKEFSRVAAKDGEALGAEGASQQEAAILPRVSGANPYPVGIKQAGIAGFMMGSLEPTRIDPTDPYPLLSAGLDSTLQGGLTAFTFSGAAATVPHLSAAVGLTKNAVGSALRRAAMEEVPGVVVAKDLTVKGTEELATRELATKELPSAAGATKPSFLAKVGGFTERSLVVGVGSTPAALASGYLGAQLRGQEFDWKQQTIDNLTLGPILGGFDFVGMTEKAPAMITRAWMSRGTPPTLPGETIGSQAPRNTFIPEAKPTEAKIESGSQSTQRASTDADHDTKVVSITTSPQFKPRTPGTEGQDAKVDGPDAKVVSIETSPNFKPKTAGANDPELTPPRAANDNHSPDQTNHRQELPLAVGAEDQQLFYGPPLPNGTRTAPTLTVVEGGRVTQGEPGGGTPIIKMHAGDGHGGAHGGDGHDASRDGSASISGLPHDGAGPTTLDTGTGHREERTGPREDRPRTADRPDREAPTPPRPQPVRAPGANDLVLEFGHPDNAANRDPESYRILPKEGYNGAPTAEGVQTFRTLAKELLSVASRKGDSAHKERDGQDFTDAVSDAAQKNPWIISILRAYAEHVPLKTEWQVGRNKMEALVDKAETQSADRRYVQQYPPVSDQTHRSFKDGYERLRDVDRAITAVEKAKTGSEADRGEAKKQKDTADQALRQFVVDGDQSLPAIRELRAAARDLANGKQVSDQLAQTFDSRYVRETELQPVMKDGKSTGVRELSVNVRQTQRDDFNLIVQGAKSVVKAEIPSDGARDPGEPTRYQWYTALREIADDTIRISPDMNPDQAKARQDLRTSLRDYADQTTDGRVRSLINDLLTRPGEAIPQMPMELGKGANDTRWDNHDEREPNPANKSIFRLLQDHPPNDAPEKIAEYRENIINRLNDVAAQSRVRGNDGHPTAEARAAEDVLRTANQYGRQTSNGLEASVLDYYFSDFYFSDGTGARPNQQHRLEAFPTLQIEEQRLQTSRDWRNSPDSEPDRTTPDLLHGKLIAGNDYFEQLHHSMMRPGDEIPTQWAGDPKGSVRTRIDDRVVPLQNGREYVNQIASDYVDPKTGARTVTFNNHIAENPWTGHIERDGLQSIKLEKDPERPSETIATARFSGRPDRLLQVQDWANGARWEMSERDGENGTTRFLHELNASDGTYRYELQDTQYDPVKKANQGTDVDEYNWGVKFPNGNSVESFGRGYEIRRIVQEDGRTTLLLRGNKVLSWEGARPADPAVAEQVEAAYAKQREDIARKDPGQPGRPIISKLHLEREQPPEQPNQPEQPPEQPRPPEAPKPPIEDLYKQLAASKTNTSPEAHAAAIEAGEQLVTRIGEMSPEQFTDWLEFSARKSPDKHFPDTETPNWEKYNVKDVDLSGLDLAVMKKLVQGRGPEAAKALQDWLTVSPHKPVDQPYPEVLAKLNAKFTPDELPTWVKDRMYQYADKMPTSEGQPQQWKFADGMPEPMQRYIEGHPDEGHALTNNQGRPFAPDSLQQRLDGLRELARLHPEVAQHLMAIGGQDGPALVRVLQNANNPGSSSPALRNILFTGAEAPAITAKEINSLDVMLDGLNRTRWAGKGRDDVRDQNLRITLAATDVGAHPNVRPQVKDILKGLGTRDRAYEPPRNWEGDKSRAQDPYPDEPLKVNMDNDMKITRMNDRRVQAPERAEFARQLWADRTSLEPQQVEKVVDYKLDQIQELQRTRQQPEADKQASELWSAPEALTDVQFNKLADYKISRMNTPGNPEADAQANDLWAGRNRLGVPQLKATAEFKAARMIDGAQPMPVREGHADDLWKARAELGDPALNDPAFATVNDQVINFKVNRLNPADVDDLWSIRKEKKADGVTDSLTEDQVKKLFIYKGNHLNSPDLQEGDKHARDLWSAYDEIPANQKDNISKQLISFSLKRLTNPETSEADKDGYARDLWNVRDQFNSKRPADLQTLTNYKFERMQRLLSAEGHSDAARAEATDLWTVQGKLSSDQVNSLLQFKVDDLQTLGHSDAGRSEAQELWGIKDRLKDEPLRSLAQFKLDEMNSLGHTDAGRAEATELWSIHGKLDINQLRSLAQFKIEEMQSLGHPKGEGEANDLIAVVDQLTPEQVRALEDFTDKPDHGNDDGTNGGTDGGEPWRPTTQEAVDNTFDSLQREIAGEKPDYTAADTTANRLWGVRYLLTGEQYKAVLEYKLSRITDDPNDHLINQLNDQVTTDVDQKLALMSDQKQSPDVRERQARDLWQLHEYLDAERLEPLTAHKVQRMQDDHLEWPLRDREAEDLQTILDKLSEDEFNAVLGYQMGRALDRAGLERSTSQSVQDQVNEGIHKLVERMNDQNAPAGQRDQAALSLRNEFHDLLRAEDNEPALLNAYLRSRPELAHLAQPEGAADAAVGSAGHTVADEPAQVIQTVHEAPAESEPGKEKDTTGSGAAVTNPPVAGKIPAEELVAGVEPLPGEHPQERGRGSRTEELPKREKTTDPAEAAVARKLADLEAAGRLEGRPVRSNQLVIVHDAAAGSDVYGLEGTASIDFNTDTATVHFDDGTEDGFDRVIDLDSLTALKKANEAEEDDRDEGDWGVRVPGNKKAERQPVKRQSGGDDEKGYEEGEDDEGRGGRRRR